MGGNGSRWGYTAPRLYAAVLVAMLATHLVVFVRYQAPGFDARGGGAFQPLVVRGPDWWESVSGSNQENFKHFLHLQPYLRGRRVLVPEPVSNRQPWHWTHVALAQIESYPRDRRMRRPLDPRAEAARPVPLRHLEVLLPRDARRSRHDPWCPQEPPERVYLVPTGRGDKKFYLVHEDDLDQQTFRVARRRGARR